MTVQCMLPTQCNVHSAVPWYPLAPPEIYVYPVTSAPPENLYVLGTESHLRSTHSHLKSDPTPT